VNFADIATSQRSVNFRSAKTERIGQNKIINSISFYNSLKNITSTIDFYLTMSLKDLISYLNFKTKKRILTILIYATLIINYPKKILPINRIDLDRTKYKKDDDVPLTHSLQSFNIGLFDIIDLASSN